MPARRRSVPGMIGGALLNLAALGGLVCIVLVVLSTVFHVSLIMFKTGSMSPTIPAGSLAAVREIPASEIEIGDVVTVDRPGDLPVTHRVTSVSGEGETRTITMKGDANEAPDPSPYTVTEVRRVLASVPGLAYTVVWFSNPWVLGTLTIGASVLVTWAFWPRNPRRWPQGASGEDAAGAAARDEPAPVRGRHGAGARIGSGAAAVAVGFALAVAPAPRAEAQGAGVEEQIVRGEHLTLTSIGDPAEMRAMRVGIPVHWQVGVGIRAAGAKEASVDVALNAAGSHELGLNVDVRACTQRWVDARCAGDEQLLRASAPADPDTGFESLLAWKGGAERWFLITAEIPEPASGVVELTLRATGFGEEVTSGPGEVHGLPTTGGAGIGPAALLGAGALAVGLSAAGAARAMARRRVRSVS
ncbi:signal peptidase I [Leucobacter ruminantium]|uniref:Signal peptidase I n=2 Tax=Leucobacter ruminantium TaxID=1289170 RepID=A0A939LUG5_9MICO|nr:signal peptidase I [Leucobacter ruminantium]